ncbi:hypothetical protein IWW55_005717, partial [Coemansia sp. RSA 2706]
MSGDAEVARGLEAAVGDGIVRLRRRCDGLKPAGSSDASAKGMTLELTSGALAVSELDLAPKSDAASLDSRGR